MRTYQEILSEMSDTYQQLSGIAPDDASDIGIRLKTLAYQIYSLENSVAQMEQQLFPQTAAGDYLDLHAEQRGISRKPGVAAEGEVTFTRASLVEGDISIPAGTVLSTLGEDSVRYQTSADLLMGAGEETANAHIICQIPGNAGNALPNTIKMMVTPISGISSVTNSDSILGGLDQEPDESLRSRLLESYRSISNGANSAYYLQEALSIDEIAAAKVISRARGRGTVDIVVYGNNAPPSQETLDTLQQMIGHKREINVDVQVSAAQARPENISAVIYCRAGYLFETLKLKAEQAIHDYISQLSVGQPLYYSAVTSLLMGIEGVANCTVSGSDVYPQERQIITAGSIVLTSGGTVS